MMKKRINKVKIENLVGEIIILEKIIANSANLFTKTEIQYAKNRMESLMGGLSVEELIELSERLNEKGF